MQGHLNKYILHFNTLLNKIFKYINKRGESVEYRSIFTGESAPMTPGDKKNNKENPPAPPDNKKEKLKLAVLILGASLLAGFAAGVFMAFTQDVPEVADLKSYKPSMTTAIYDNNGNLVTQLYSEQRTLVKIDQIPDTLKKAIIAKEDPRFYQHGGLDFRGIVRAAFNNLTHGKIVEGASTITMQLANNLFLTREKRFTRKIKQALLALQIEKYYTKDEILEMYFNQIYFGSGAHGVEAAARTYFGKHAEELTLPECAMLAALPQAPSGFSPYRNPALALEKRNIVLGIMADKGVITPAERDSAIASPLVLSKLEVRNAPYFAEYVRQQLAAKYGDQAIYKGGLKVTTTLDSNLQQICQDVLAAHIKQLENKISVVSGKTPDPEKPLQGALIAIEPSTGYIKAMIGGMDFSGSEFNRAVQSRRQTGSSFKPIVYTAAIDNGFRVSDIIMDSPIVYKNENGTDWRPENFNGKFGGPSTILDGLTFSTNVVTIKLLSSVGTSTVAKYARKMGITSPLTKDLTMGLGSSSISLLEMVTAFSVLASGGMKPEPLSILSVKDSEGKEILHNEPKISEALNETTAYIVTYMLQNAIDRGTGKTIRNLGFTAPFAGKTGTTNEFTDVWFIGFTPNIVIGVWIGYDEKESMGSFMTGGFAAAPVVGEIMLKAFGNKTDDFPVPEKIVFKKICRKTGFLADVNCPKTLDMPFVTGSEPTKTCTLHSGSGSFIDTEFDEEGDTESHSETSKPSSNKKQKDITAAPVKKDTEEDVNEESKDKTSGIDAFGGF